MGFQTMSGIPKVTSTANFYSNTNPLLQSRGIGGFTQPSALFGNGEQGAWWDFSDLTVMFQDSAGTVPAVLESPVGKILDKSGKNNHLIQATAGARPVLSRRFNALTGTRGNLVSNGWVQVNCTGTVQPDGSSLLTRSSTVSAGYTQYSVAYATGTTLRVRQKVRYANNGNYYGFRYQGTYPDRVDVVVDLTNGAVAYQGSTNYSLANIKVSGLDSQGFYTVQFDLTTAVTAGTTYLHGPTTFATGGWESATATLVSAYASQPDLRLLADANLAIPEYQWVDTAAVYDTLGFPAYLLFDGATKWMQSAASVDLSTYSYLTPIVGVTKLLDTAAAYGSIVEISVDPTGNGKSFTLGGYTAVGDPSRRTYGWFQYNVSSAENVSAGAIYGGPTTNVVSGLYRSTGALDSTMIQGYVDNVYPPTSWQSSNVWTTAPGGYGNYPIFVGARGGVSSFFNGRMFGVILRAATTQTNDNDLQMTNRWMGSKCGKFF